LWIPLALLLAFAAQWGYGRLPIEQIREGAAAAQAQLSGMVQLPEIITPTATPAQGNTARPAQVMPSPSPTRPPTATRTRPPSATPSPTPTATATGGAREYVVQSGDSLALIGEKFDLAWQTIAALNGLTAYSMLQPGDKLRLPTLTPAPPRATTTATSGATRTNTPTAAPSATTAPTGIASPKATLAATGIPTRTPTEGERGAPTATASPTATRQPTLTATPTSTSAPSLTAPVLSNPGDQAPYSGDTAQIMFEWQSRDGLPRGAVYRLTITWTEKGIPQFYFWDTVATSLRAAGWLWGRADQPDRRYTWFVQILQLATDGKGGERVILLSPSSEKRIFYWY
jgi:LysM repeat protein